MDIPPIDPSKYGLAYSLTMSLMVLALGANAILYFVFHAAAATLLTAQAIGAVASIILAGLILGGYTRA